jgi:deoxycytidylate deaminase
MDFSALIANNNKIINRKYNDAVSGQNLNHNELMPKRTAVEHVAEQLDRVRIAHEEAARTRAYNNRTKK